MSIVLLNTSFTVDDESQTTVSTPSLEMILSSQTRFWILLAFEIPSFLCCLVLLYYFCFNQAIRKLLHNHVFIFILINVFLSELIDIPNYLVFLQLNHVWPSVPLNCYIWWYVTYGCYPLIGILMAWDAIERHIFIFHHRWLNTAKKRLFIHYTPLAINVAYGYIFYAVCIFGAPCQSVFDYTSTWCDAPCYRYLIDLVRMDTIVNVGLPCILILIVNIFLCIRVIKQKQRLRQQINWHKYRRMIIQVGSCSLLFLLAQVPVCCLYIAYLFGIPYNDSAQFQMILPFLGYFVPLLIPFVCLASSKEIRTKILDIWKRPQLTTRIVPMTVGRVE